MTRESLAPTDDSRTPSASDSSHAPNPELPLPAPDDDRLAQSTDAIDRLSEPECRALLATMYRAVVAYEASGDIRYLTQFARQARTASLLNSRNDYRRAVEQGPSSAAPSGSALSVSEVLARLST